MKRWSLLLSLVVLLPAGLSACGSSAPSGGGSASASGSAAAPAAAAKKEEPAKTGTKSRKGGPEEVDPETGEAVAGPPKVEFQESDFSETDRSRDPFRPFADVFMEQAKSKVRSQLHVVAKEYSLDVLKLVGIVSRIHPPRAMFVDPSGVGHVVDHGDFIGKPEIVQGGTTTADYEIHWRVDRVREQDVVLIREDPANPDVPSATRVVPLQTEEPIAIQ